MTEARDVVGEALTELRAIQNGEGQFEPTSDIDVVWVISQPGTYLKPADYGIYKGLWLDRQTIDYGIDIVKKITSLRLAEQGNAPQTVTKEMILEHGPILFYNGEESTTKDHKLTQNSDLRKVVDLPGFPLPKENVVIEDIDVNNTSGQIPGFMEFLKAHPKVHKVAVVSLVAHSRRVGRYLEEFRIKHPDLFPKSLEFLNAWVSPSERGVGITLKEMRKLEKYYEKGDLASEPLKGF